MAGADFAMGTLVLEGSDWLAEWEEGTYVDGEVHRPVRSSVEVPRDFGRRNPYTSKYSISHTASVAKRSCCKPETGGTKSGFRLLGI